MPLRLLLAAVLCLSTSPCAWAQSKLYVDLQLGAEYAYAEGGHFSQHSRPFKQHRFILKAWPGVLLRYQPTAQLAVSTGSTGGGTGWGYTLKMPPALTHNAFGGSKNTSATVVYVDRIPVILHYHLKRFHFQLADAASGLYTYSLQLGLSGGIGAVRVHDFTNNALSIGPIFGKDTIDLRESTPQIVRRWGAYATVGATARFFRLGKERVTLGIHLQQGMTDLIRVGVAYEYNGRTGYQVLRSRSSGVGVAVGIPICLKSW